MGTNKNKMSNMSIQFIKISNMNGSSQVAHATSLTLIHLILADFRQDSGSSENT